MRPAVRIAILAATIAGCGPRTSGPTRADARKAPLVVVAPDAATLDRAIDLLTPMSGDRLGVIRFAVIDAWPTAGFAERGLDAAGPLGLAMTADRVIVRWATVADTGRLATALDAMPGAARWRAEGAAMWRVADAAIAVIAGARVAVVSGGAPSGRDRVALELASGELDVGATPVAGGLHLDLDGSLLVDAMVPEPGPLVTKLGADLGRLGVTLTAAPDQIGIELDAHPTADTFADHLIAGGSAGRGIVRPAGAFAFTTRVSREEALALLAELGPRRGIDVAALVDVTPAHGPKALTGALSIAFGAIAVQFSDLRTQNLIASLASGVSEAGPESSTVFGGLSGSGAGGGLDLHPESFATLPPPPEPPPALPSLDDDNTDVPWSEDFRAARRAFEAATAALDRAVGMRKAALALSRTEWETALGKGIAIPITRTAGGYHGAGAYRPPGGTIAATVAAAIATYDRIKLHDRDVDQAYAAAVAARQHALEIRAHDVSTWDREHDPR